MTLAVPAVLGSMASTVSGAIRSRVGRGVRLRHATWSEGAARMLVVLLEGKGCAEAWVVRSDPSDATVQARALRIRGWLPGEDLAAIPAATVLLPATAGMLATLFANEGERSSFEAMVTDRVRAVRSGMSAGILLVSERSPDTASSRFQGGMFISVAETEYPDFVHAERFGYASEGFDWSPLRHTGHGFTDDVPRSTSGNTASPPGERVDVAWPQGCLDSALAFIRGGIDARPLALLGDRHWSPRAHAYYSGDGDIAVRRAQAALSYPGFAPLIASRPSVSGLVDAGLPFEDALRMEISLMRGLTGGRIIPAAALRRLRSLPRDLEFGEILAAVEISARVPVDWLPREGAGWRHVASAGTLLLDVIDGIGGTTRDLLGPGPVEWARLSRTVPPEARGEPGQADLPEAVLSDARDMARFLGETLAGFLVAAGTDRDDVTAAAGSVLFAGKSLPGVDAMQRRWHRNLAVLRAAIPHEPGRSSWPAAFRPFDGGNGLTLVCLTDEDEIRREGEEQAHCVGGYGRECHGGKLHVASVRDTAGYRVSTVAFEAVTGPGGRPTLGVIQHKSAGNRPAPPAAVALVKSFLAALAAGRTALDPKALDAGGRGVYLAWYDPAVPGNLEAAFAAWAPYLPRTVARGGLPVLRDRLQRAVTALGREKVSRGEGRLQAVGRKDT